MSFFHVFFFFFFNDTATTEIYTLSLHDALPIWHDANTPYFDGTAFTNPVTNGVVHLGTTGRNILRGPGFLNINQNVSRTFNLGEKFKLQLLGEAFNLFNHPSFSTPAATFNAPTLNADGSVRSYNNYSVITSTVSSPRQLQVGAKLTF